METGRRLGRRRLDWRLVGEEIVEKVLDALDYFCWNVSGDPAEECYAAHADLSLYELAEEFLGMSGITERDLKLLRRMPQEVYDRLDARVSREIERTVEELERR